MLSARQNVSGSKLSVASSIASLSSISEFYCITSYLQGHLSMYVPVDLGLISRDIITVMLVILLVILVFVSSTRGSCQALLHANPIWL